MDQPSDRRFAGMCLVAAVAGVLVWAAFFQRHGVLLLVLPVLALAALAFVDGYLSVP